MQILIGTIIREYCDNNKITVKKLAALVGVTPDALYKMIRSNQISINLLQRISAALNFNFFSYYGATTESESNKQELEALRSAFASQKQELDQMKIRMQLLEQENTYLKQINRLLEGKSITN
jgi:transcriptional regulator with XRE-family HTH domain